MPIRNIGLLPEIFRTDANEKFINATVEQLTSETNLKKVNGYIGRTFTNLKDFDDNYISEITADRENYQLEPAVVINDSDGNATFVGHHIDLLNKIRYYGGNVNNQSRLFENEYYTYDSQIDYDKFINFSQYYWVAPGPATVDIFSSAIPVTDDIDVIRSGSSESITSGVGDYSFSNIGPQPNPILILARGGSYTFNVDQSNPFFIQTEPGISGTQVSQPNFSTREIFGVSNNGEENGTITFNVPESNAQEFYTNMPLGDTVNFAAANIAYKDIQGKYLSDFITTNDGLDGNHVLDNKLFIFVDNSTDSNDWTALDQYDNTLGFGTEFDDGELVPQQYRKGIWQINLEYDAVQDDYIIHLTATSNLTPITAIQILEGNEFNDRVFYLDNSGNIQLTPLITALQDTLYYQDGNDTNLVGVIKLVQENESLIIDVESEIINNEEYISPNGIVFTNGLKVKFDANVIPQKYANTEFYIEGVGSAITLVDTNLLVTPEDFIVNDLEQFDSTPFALTGFEGGVSSPTNKDYIVINRASIDGNAWSRSNRWFHIDVLREAAKYENFELIIDQSARANRPIIEFNANLQLFNTGSVAVEPIDVLDTLESDALSNVHGAPAPLILDGITMDQDMRVVFLNDTNATARKTVYTVKYDDLNNDGFDSIRLVPDPIELTEGSNILIRFGLANQAKMFYLRGGLLVESQIKSKINQPPLFDMFNISGNSLSDLNIYTNSSFKGTELFSYAIGTGVTDKVLGFPLKYKNFSTVGDIVFENDFDTDVFTYTVDQISITDKINKGMLHKIVDSDNFTSTNVWKKAYEESSQGQLFTFTDFTNQIELDVDIIPEKNVIHYKVYADSIELPRSSYSLSNRTITITSDISSITQIDVLVNAKSFSNTAWYQVPANLENNAQNAVFSTLTLGQIRNHIKSAYDKSTDVTGIFPGDSDLRDVSTALLSGGNILQHSAGIGLANLFLLDDRANFVESTLNAQQEYTRFKNKFFDLAERLDFDVNDPVAAVDTIINFINQVKTPEFPWYSSDMVPFGDTNKITYEVIELINRDYELTSIFNKNILSNKAVLVYNNGKQLVSNVDYDYNDDRPYITMRPEYNLQLNDIITIREYENTDGNWIPETPSKLGLYPSFAPEIIIDDTYITAVTMIRGHDGSLTPAYDDYRDEIILELEKRIFNNIKSKFDEDRFSINSVKPGKFRDNDYNLDEFNLTLSRMFFKFVGENKLDYRLNDFFDSNNGFTYNYRKFGDKIDNSPLNGSWRAIFNYYYDTTSPHIRPWEMLGFSIKPLWWEANYGPAPYTSGNLVLWDDLEKGIIKAGNRAGIDPKYVRPGLTDILPVNQFGELINPNEFLVNGPSIQYATEAFTVGEEGPIESAWRNSSQFPYAMQIIMSLLKPARYFGLYADVQNYNYNTELRQYIHDVTNQRLTQFDIKINGEVENDSILRSASYINWIADYIKGDGVSPTSYLGSMLTNYEINLSYKVAGFTDKSLLKVIGEQSSPSSTTSSIIIPDEDYQIKLNKSAPIVKINYSAIIIETTAIGFKVDGYNLGNPHFTILPSIQNNNTQPLSVLNDTITTYRNFSNQPVSVPYGTEFTSKKALVDFLISYGRWLERQGFIFNEYNTETQEINNWTLSAKEFLFWSQQGWGEQNILSLNPLSNRIHLNTPGAVAGEIKQTSPGSLLDRNFNPINNNNFTVKRIDNEFELVATETIGFLEIPLIQHEHILIFKNITVFKDIIYQSELGNRQIRLKLVGSVSNNWNGNLAPGGFIYNEDNVQEWQQGKDYKRGDIIIYKSNRFVAVSNIVGSTTFDYNSWEISESDNIKTGLLPNFSNLASRSESFYDIDDVNLENDIDLYSKGLLGYRTRDYFSDLGIDDTSQIKFYQNMIREKGTRSSVEALTRAELKNDNADINVYEEWALRVGEYGAIDSTSFIETRLKESEVTANPSLLVFKDSNDTANKGAINVFPKDIHNGPADYKKDIFLLEEINRGLDHNIKTAGQPILSEVDYTLFSFDDYYTLNDYTTKIGIGQSIWIANDINQDWNVYRISATPSEVRSVEIIDNIIKLNTNIHHKLDVDDRIMIRNVSDLLDGWYIVSKINDLNTLSIIPQVEIDDNVFDTNGHIFRLESIRYDNVTELQNTLITRDNEKVYIDVSDVDNNWSVIEKTSPWKFNTRILPAPQDANINYGTSVAASPDGFTIYSSAPEANNLRGEVEVSVKNSLNAYNLLTKLSAQSSATAAFGYSITTGSDNLVAIGAPHSFNNSGQVHIYKFDSGLSNTFRPHQILSINDLSSNHYFGASMKCSTDNKWLYVSDASTSEILAYAWTIDGQTTIDSVTTSTNSAVPVFTLTFDVYDIARLIIKDDSGKHYIPGIDYNLVNSNTIKFTTGFNYDVTGNKTIIFSSQGSYYKKIGAISVPQIDPTLVDYSINTSDDGSYVSVGIPSLSGPGTVEMYYRQSVRFVTSEFQTVFQTIEYYDPTILTVELNNVLLDSGQYILDPVNGLVILLSTPPTNSTLSININQFSKIQDFVAPIDQHSNGNEYGYTSGISGDSSVVAIGMPGYDNGDTQTNNGIVYSYTNQASKFGKIISKFGTGTLLNIGDSISINHQTIYLTGSNTQACVNDINTANISGITAELDDQGRVVILSESTLATEKLSVLPGMISSQVLINNAFADLGFEVFIKTAELDSPLSLANERFGSALDINEDGSIIVVGSADSSSTVRTIIDNNDTVFDNNSTRFGHVSKDSGAVTVFEYQAPIYETIDNPGSYIIGQQLVGEGLSRDDKFGSSIILVNKIIVVGAPGDSINNVRSGSTYTFRNELNSLSWKEIRKQQQRVEVNAINKIFAYDNNTQLISSYLDYIDPIKGKILGRAAQEITYLTNNDPALYNVANDIDFISESTYWSNNHIGKVWWDLSTMRYIDYEQGTVEYKFQNWGKIFPGSSIDVYEWILTDVLPSEYIDAGYDGVPKDVDDSLYTARELIDTVSGLLVTKYYYWVKDKTTVDVNESDFRTLPISTVANLIEFPKAQDIPYVEILDSSSVGLVNVNNLLQDDNIILHIDYDVNLNTDIIHAEYALLQEGGSSKIPAKTINKIIDSLAGIDKLSNNVPDLNVPLSQRYGIDVRPRQSMTINRLSAVEAITNQTNIELSKYRILDTINTPLLYASDPLPNVSIYNELVDTLEILELIDVTNKPVGYKVVVVQDSTVDNYWVLYSLDTNKVWTVDQVQSFDTTRFWSPIDWYADGYNSVTDINKTYQTRLQLHTIQTPTIGDIIKINDNGNSQWELLIRTVDGYDTIAVENATIELSNELYIPSSGAGFGSLGFGLGRWDQSPQQETRNIFDSVLTEIFVDNLIVIRNKLFFVLVRHIFAEQHNIDWIFKTSFISVNQSSDKLIQSPIFRKDNVSYLEDYINEVKPYRTKIREYLVNYRKTEIWDGDVTDFDVPAYYDFSLNRFRSPDGSLASDDALLSDQPEYRNWYDNHAYHITDISVASGGSGYNITTPPAIIISGGGGTGAKATARVVGGVIISINVTAPGSGYTSTPTIIFDTGSGTAARAYAHLSNETIRKIKTTIKFDRVAYDTTVKDYTALTNYVIDDIITYNGNAFRAIVDFASDGNATFVPSNMEIVPAESFDNAMDRTWAFYQPTPGMIGRDLGQIFNGITYPGIEIVGPVFDSGYSSYGFGSGSFGGGNEYTELDTITDGGTLITNFNGSRPGEMDIDGGRFVDEYNSHAPEELLPGRVFDTIDMQTYTFVGSDYENNGANTRSAVRTISGDGITDTFIYADPDALDTDKLFVYSYNNGRLRETTDYSVNYNNKAVTFFTVPDITDTIIIYVSDHVGVGIVANNIEIGDGGTTDYTIDLPLSILNSILVTVDGIEVPHTVTSPQPRETTVQLLSPPYYGARVHIRGFFDNSQASSDVISKIEIQESTLSGNVVALLSTLRNREPFAAQIVAEINGLRLTPPAVDYWLGDGSQTAWVTPDLRTGIDPATIPSTDINVYIDGQITTNWVLEPLNVNNLTNRTITVNPPAPSGSSLAIELITESEYIIDNNNIVINTPFAVNDELLVTTWGNHDTRRIRTTVNQAIAPIALPPSGIYTDPGYLWVSLNGRRLHPNIDFNIDSDNSTVELLIAYQPTDVIVISAFTEELVQPQIAHRMFQDISGAVTYLRISEEYSTRLTADALLDDIYIEVVDVSRLAQPNVTLAQPGIIFINGERIAYYGRGPTSSAHPNFPNMPANSIWNLSRGTHGTSAASIHLSNDVAVCGSKRQEIPETDMTRIDTVLQPWVSWNVIVDTNAELTALDPNGFRPGAKALILQPDNVANTQEEYRAVSIPSSIQSETNPGLLYPIGELWWDTTNNELNNFDGAIWTVIGTEDVEYTVEWQLYNTYIDRVWNTNGGTNPSDGLGLQSADTIQSLFLKAKPSVLPDL